MSTEKPWYRKSRREMMRDNRERNGVTFWNSSLSEYLQERRERRERKAMGMKAFLRGDHLKTVETVFDPMSAGGLMVEVPIQSGHITVTAISEANTEHRLYAQPRKHPDGSWVAFFPQVPAGNWRVEMSYRYGSGKSHNLSSRVTVFPGNAATVVLKEQ